MRTNLKIGCLILDIRQPIKKIFGMNTVMILRNKCLIVVMIISLILGCTGCKNAESHFEFCLYLAETDEFGEITQSTEPLFTVDDIISYIKETHEIELEKPVIHEINLLSPGQQFIVCVGEERIYSGTFQSMLSSNIEPGACIYLPSIDNTIRIFGIFRGDDLRQDSRIIDSLTKHGKLHRN